MTAERLAGRHNLFSCMNATDGCIGFLHLLPPNGKAFNRCHWLFRETIGGKFPRMMEVVVMRGTGEWLQYFLPSLHNLYCFPFKGPPLPCQHSFLFCKMNCIHLRSFIFHSLIRSANIAHVKITFVIMVRIALPASSTLTRSNKWFVFGWCLKK